MLYFLYFLVGDTIMVLALLLSQSKYLFLSGIITALPILTFINMGMQMKNMKEDTFILFFKTRYLERLACYYLLCSRFS